MKSKYSLVSVVMLNYNGLKYLKRTIKPILKLDYPNYEFIIVDNGSTDGSIEYIKSHKRIRLIKSPKLREKNFACNYAIKRAKGKYILLLDNDALITDKDILTNLVERYDKKTGVIGLAFFNESENFSKGYGGYFSYLSYIAENKFEKNYKIYLFDNYNIGFPHGFCLFISKKKWLEVGGYDDSLIFGGDDNDLGIKLLLMGYENKIYSKTLQIHIGMPERDDNLKYQLKWKEMLYAHLYTIAKYYSLLNLFISLFFYSLFAFLKSIKQSIFRLSFGPFLAFFQSYYLFIKNLPDAIKKRKVIQSKRIVKEDIFLRIKPPKFY